MRFSFRVWSIIFSLSLLWIFGFYFWLGRWGVGLSFALLVLIHFYFSFLVVNKIKNLWRFTPPPGHFRWEMEQIASECYKKNRSSMPKIWTSRDTDYNVLSLELAGQLHIFMSLKFLNQTTYAERYALVTRLLVEHKNGITLAKTLVSSWLYFWQFNSSFWIIKKTINLLTRSLFPSSDQIEIDKKTRDLLNDGAPLARVIEKLDHWNQLSTSEFAPYTWPLWFVTPLTTARPERYFAVSEKTKLRLSSIMGKYPY